MQPTWSWHRLALLGLLLVCCCCWWPTVVHAVAPLLTYTTGAASALALLDGWLYTGSGIIQRWGISDASRSQADISTVSAVSALAADDTYLYATLQNGTWDVMQYFTSNNTRVRNMSGHTGRCVSIRLRGGYAWTVAYDWSIRQWDSENGSNVWTASPSDVLFLAALDLGDASLVAGGYGQNLTIQPIFHYHLGNQSLVRRWEAHTGRIESLALLGDYCYSASRDRDCRQWAISNGSSIATFTLNDSPLTIVVSTDYLFAGGIEPTLNTIVQLAIANGSTVSTYAGHLNRVYQLVLGGQLLYSASLDGTVCKWRGTGLPVPTSARLTRTLFGHTDSVVTLAAWDGMLYSGDTGGTLKTWNAASGALQSTVTTGMAFAGMAVDASFLYCAFRRQTEGNKLTQYNISTFSEVRAITYGDFYNYGFSVYDSQMVVGFVWAVECLHSSNGSILWTDYNIPYVYYITLSANYLIAGGLQSTLDIGVRHAANRTMAQLLVGHASFVLSVALQADSLFSGGQDNICIQWNLGNGSILHVFAFQRLVLDVVVSPGSLFVSGFEPYDVVQWDTRPGNWSIVYRYQSHTKQVNGLLIFNGSLFSASGDWSVKQWAMTDPTSTSTSTSSTSSTTTKPTDTTSISSATQAATSSTLQATATPGPLRRTLTGHASEVVGLAVQGSYLYSADLGRAVKRWDLATGTELTSVDAPIAVHAVVAQPASLFGAGGQAEGASSFPIVQWLTVNLTLARELSGHADEVWGLFLLPLSSATSSGDGNMDQGLLSGSYDRTLRRWSTENGTATWSVTLATALIAVAAAGSHVFAGGFSTDITQLALGNRSVVRILASHADYVNTLTPSADGASLYSGSDDMTCKHWSVGNGSLLWDYVHQALVMHVVPVSLVTGDGLLAAGEEPFHLTLWSASLGNRTTLRRYRGHANRVWRVLAQGAYLYSASADTTIRQWRLPGMGDATEAATTAEESTVTRTWEPTSVNVSDEPASASSLSSAVSGVGSSTTRSISTVPQNGEARATQSGEAGAQVQADTGAITLAPGAIAGLVVGSALILLGGGMAIALYARRGRRGRRDARRRSPFAEAPDHLDAGDSTSRWESAGTA